MEWRPAYGFESYEVSSYGDVRRAASLVRMKGYLDSDGYVTYCLRTSDGRRKHIAAHRLVLLSFVGPSSDDRDQAAHGDGSRLHNHPSNLRWATSQENHDDRLRHSMSPKGVKNPKAKVTEEDVRFIRREYRAIKARGSGRRVTELEDQFGLCRSAILDIAKRRTWSHVH